MLNIFKGKEYWVCGLIVLAIIAIIIWLTYSINYGAIKVWLDRPLQTVSLKDVTTILWFQTLILLIFGK